MEIPGTGTRKYDSKKAPPAPNRKVARTTLAGSRRLSIEAIVQRTSIEGAMAAAPRVDGRAAKISLVRRSIGWLPIKEELSRRTAYWQSFNGSAAGRNLLAVVALINVCCWHNATFAGLPILVVTGGICRSQLRRLPRNGRRLLPHALVALEVRYKTRRISDLSLIHISEPTRRTPISYAVFCLKK